MSRVIALLASTLATCSVLAAEGSTGSAANPRSCVNSREQLPLIDLERLFLDKGGKLEFTAKSACLALPDAPPVAAARLALPSFADPYVLRVESLFRGGYVMPRLEFLDADGKLTREVDAKSFRQRGAEVSTDIFMKADNAAERFFVIYPDPAQIGRGVERSALNVQSAFVPISPGGVLWMSGSDKTTTVTQSELGRLVISLLSEQWDAKRKARH